MPPTIDATQAAGPEEHRYEQLKKETPGSPLWWTLTLEKDLDTRQPLVQFYEDYYEGRHKLSFATAKFREVFAEMLAAVSDNWLPLVIGASTERLRVQGFRVGSEAADADAWEIWQRNQLDVDSRLLFREAAKHGEAYLLNWPDNSRAATRGVFGRLFSRKGRDVLARVTAEHPSQVIVRREAGDRRRRAAALKKWIEDDGTVMATLWLPDSTHRWQRKDKPDAKWEPRAGVEHESKNPWGVVPVVPIVNDGHLMPCKPPTGLLKKPHSLPSVAIGLGRSDMADVITTVDQINKLLCDMMVASEVAGFRQRYVAGLEIDNDENGKPKMPWEHGVDRLFTASDPNTKFGEFGITELSNYTGAIATRIDSLSARTRCPAHYVLGKFENVSGDTLKSAETGLVCKVKDKQADHGEGLEESNRISFAIEGKEDKAAVIDSETNWADPETRTESEHIDSLVKKLTIGVPKEQLWDDAGYSPQQIKRFKDMLLEEATRQGVFDPNGQGLPPEPAPPEPAPGAGV